MSFEQIGDSFLYTNIPYILNINATGKIATALREASCGISTIYLSKNYKDDIVAVAKKDSKYGEPIIINSNDKEGIEELSDILDDFDIDSIKEIYNSLMDNISKAKSVLDSFRVAADIESVNLSPF